MKNIIPFISGICFCFYFSATAQNPGSPDLSFGAGGKIKYDFGLESLRIHHMVMGQDGSLILTGQAQQTAGSSEDIFVAVMKSDGTPNLSFNQTGYILSDIFNAEDAGKQVALQPDGKILVVGWAHNGSNFDIVLVRYLNDGSPDPGFGNNGKVIRNLGSTDFGMAIQILKDNKIVLVCRKYNGSNSDIALLRFLPDGTPDVSFGNNGVATSDITGNHEYPYDSELLADGSIVVAGDAEKEGFSVFFAAKFDTSGNLQSDFGSQGYITHQIGSGNNGVLSLCVQEDQKLILGGYAYSGSETKFALLRANADGSIDQTFGQGGAVISDITSGNAYIQDVLSQSDGSIIVCGVANGSTTNADFIVMRLLNSGNIDPNFGLQGLASTDFSNGLDMASAILRVSDQKLMVAGYNATGELLLAKYHNNVSSFTQESEIAGAWFEITPNPISEKAMLRFNPKFSAPEQVLLYNRNGVCVSKFVVNEPDSGSIPIDLGAAIPCGDYYCVVRSGKVTIIRKVIKL